MTRQADAATDTTTRTCPKCGEDVLQRVARATFDSTAFSRLPRATSYPVIVRCSREHAVRYAPVPNLDLARKVRDV